MRVSPLWFSALQLVKFLRIMGKSFGIISSGLIHGAPVAGVEPPEKVLAWIEKRITCQIPDKDKEPKLYDLVTRYQMHECSAYCKKPKKCGTVFVIAAFFSLCTKI